MCRGRVGCFPRLCSLLSQLDCSFWQHNELERFEQVVRGIQKAQDPARAYFARRCVHEQFSNHSRELVFILFLASVHVASVSVRMICSHSEQEERRETVRVQAFHVVSVVFRLLRSTVVPRSHSCYASLSSDCPDLDFFPLLCDLPALFLEYVHISGA